MSQMIINMKKIVFSFLLLGAAGYASAQTLTSTDFGSVGDTYQLGLDNTPGVGPGTAGASQTWNFTTLNTESLDTLVFVNPATLPNAADFPGSNIATVSDQGVFYLEKTTNYIRNHGVVAVFGFLVASINFTPPVDLLQFPTNFGDSFSNTSMVAEKQFIGIDTNFLGCQITIDSAYIIRHVVHDVDIDGSGTLQLPTDTFTNALRSYTEERTVDSIFIYAPNAINCAFPPVNIPQGWSFADPTLLTLAGFSGNPSFDTTRIYNWYAPGEKFSVCAIDVNSNGSPISCRFKSNVAHLTLGLNEPFQLESSVYPNPANDQMRITATESLAGTHVQVVDVTGKVVLQQQMNEQGIISTLALEEGIYLYMIRDDQNKPLTKGRFMVVR